MGDRRTHRTAWRVAAAAAVAVLAALVAATPSSAQEPGDNFAYTGLDASTGLAVAVADGLSGQFSYCRNANGLGSELFLEASGPSGLSVRHATVSPMVVPLHIGVIDISNPDESAPISDTFVTLGVVAGDSVPFGTSDVAAAQYGGIAASRSGVGILSWTHTGVSDCSESTVMPILTPIIEGAGIELPDFGSITTTTAAPPTTEAPTTTAAPTTTEAPSTTEAPTTTAAPTTTEAPSTTVAG